MSGIKDFLKKRRYSFLLVALLMHLFNAVFFVGYDIYTQWVWPSNMLLLGIASFEIFSERNKIVRVLKNLLFAGVMALTFLAVFIEGNVSVMTLLTVFYLAFYLIIFIEVLRFLARPSYINGDIIVAAICGYLLLIEIGVFSMQYVYYILPSAMHNIDATNKTTVFIDLVYYCSITITSIGFGDILPTHHITKMLTSVLGISGQFYSVVLVGIIISKYTSRNQTNN